MFDDGCVTKCIIAETIAPTKYVIVSAAKGLALAGTPFAQI